jgi:hypothetical protein
MLKMAHQYSRKSGEFKFINKWFEGSKYLFNANQKKRLEKALN